MKEIPKDALDRIIVKDNARMGQIIDWYKENMAYLEAQPFKMPFPSGLVCLKEENIEFSFQAWTGHQVLIKVYVISDQKEHQGQSIGVCAFLYDTEEDVIIETRYPKGLPEKRLAILKMMLATDQTCTKEAFKFRVLMFYAVYYENEVVVDKAQEKPHTRAMKRAIKRAGNPNIPVPLVRSTYVINPEAKTPKKIGNSGEKRSYQKPDHEVKVKGYRRRNGTWVEPYVRYKDRAPGTPKTYKA